MYFSDLTLTASRKPKESIQDIHRVKTKQKKKNQNQPTPSPQKKPLTSSVVLET